MSMGRKSKIHTNGRLHATRAQKLPPELQPLFKKSTLLEWLTIFYLLSVAILMYITLGTSQAMKVAWLEDIFSIVPAISFLVAARFYDRKPTGRFPYGYHRAYTIAHQLGSFALLGIGLFVFYDSAKGLLSADRPTIGSTFIFGQQLWMGWIMIAVLLWSAIPAMILGRVKLPLAYKLHNKILYTDANTQKADWETALAAIAGVIGIGFGIWWADGVAACFISVSIIVDGAKRLWSAMADMLDEVPTHIDKEELHPLIDKVHSAVNNMLWVSEARIRMRESGAMFLTEIWIIPADTERMMERIEDTIAELKRLDWKIKDIVVMPVRQFDGQPDIKERPVTE